MPLFKHRPLAALSVLFLFGIFVSVITDSAVTFVVGALSAFLLLLFLVFFLFAHRPAKRQSGFLCLCAAVLLLSQIFSFFAYIRPIARLPIGASEVTVQGRVEAVHFSSDYATECYVALLEIDGTDASGRILLHTDSAEDIMCGDCISFTATFTALSDDEAAYLRAEGCLARAQGVGPISFLTYAPTLADRINTELAALRNALSSRLTENIEGEGGRLLSAMLLGDRDALSPTTVRDFRRLGMSHVLAISGLHLHILFFLFSALFARLGIKRSHSLLLLSLLLVFYVALTGFSLSVLRAGGMALLLSLSFLVREETDSLTSLSLSATLICLFLPSSVYDVGFLLSCFATLGILIATEMQRKRALQKPSPAARFFEKIGSAVLITLAATLATLPITALYFGEISLFSLPANLLLTPLFSLYLACAPFALLLAPIPFVGTVLAAIGNGLLYPMALLADLPHALLDISYTDFVFIVLGGGALFLLLLCCVKSRRTLAVVGGCILATLVLSLGVHTALLYTRSEARYFENEGNEYLLLTEGGSGLLYEATDAAFHTQDEVLSLIDEAHLCELDAYILSHYHSRHPEAMASIFDKIRVSRLYLPIPASDAEEEIYRDLVAVATEHRVSVCLYKAREEIPHGALTLIPFSAAEDEHLTLALSVKRGDKTLTYLSSDKNALCAPAVANSHYLIFGTHGVPQNGYLPYTQYNRSLLTVIAPAAEERLHPTLLALFKQRGLLHAESTYVISLS